MKVRENRKKHKEHRNTHRNNKDNKKKTKFDSQDQHYGNDTCDKEDMEPEVFKRAKTKYIEEFFVNERKKIAQSFFFYY